MNIDTLNKIKSEIEEGGIPLQVYSSIALDKLGWYVKQNSFYNLFNKNGESEREIDIIAEKNSFISRLKNVLILECKKSRKPWVFFEQGTKVGEDPFIVTALGKENLLIYELIEDNFKKFHYFGKEIHTYFHTAFFKEDLTRDEQYSPIHKAIKQVLSGYKFILDQNEDFLSKGPETIDGYFFYPLIILEGELLSAKIIENGEIVLEEKDHISLLLTLEREKTLVIRGREKAQGLRSKKIIIDIVKKEYLEDFLKDSFA